MTIYTRTFPEQCAESYLGLVREMNGASVRGFHPAKIGFDTEMLLQRPPTAVGAITRFVDQGLFDFVEECAGSVVPRAFNFQDAPQTQGPRPVLGAPDGTKICIFALGIMNRFPIRDVDADHLWYVYSGSGICYTDLGWFEFEAGDFVYVPRSILSHFESNNALAETAILIGVQSQKDLLLRTSGPFENRDVPFSQFAMKTPQPYKLAGPRLTTIRVRRGGKLTQIEYVSNPLTCVAWKGTTYPFAVSTKDLHFPYVTSEHPDPTNFAVFATADLSVVISVLGPRFVHSIPYYHLNKWDEFLFYARGYDARKGSMGGVGEAGTATLHPQGIWHGPQPEAMEQAKAPMAPQEMPWVKDLAVMIESRSPLNLCEGGRNLLIPDYEHSWQEK